MWEAMEREAIMGGADDRGRRREKRAAALGRKGRN